MTLRYPPHHPSIVSSSLGWAPLELEQAPARCAPSLCASSLLHRCCSPLCDGRGLGERPSLPFAFVAHLLINTTMFLLRFEYKMSWGISDEGSISLECRSLLGGGLRSLEWL